VRPAPQDLAGSERLEVLGERLGEDEDVALLAELLARAHAAELGRELLVGDSEALPVALLGEDAAPQLGVDALEVRGVERAPVLIRLVRRSDEAEAQLLHDGDTG
jgi:hypothetical protein